MNLDYPDIDMKKRPTLKWTWLYCIAQPLALLLAATKGHKLYKDENMKGLKGPYLVLANHASFMDFVVQLKAFKWQKLNWVVSVEEFYNIGEWVFRLLGCYPKRKFVPDVTNVMQMMYILKNNGRLVIYPEVRFSLAGIDERVDKALGKLIKKCEVPVVLQMNYGNFIQSPQWDKKPYRNPKFKTTLTQLLTKEDVQRMSAEEIQAKIEENFHYNEYEYQQEAGFKVTSKNRMKNSHKILYKCPHCGTEYEMEGSGIQIKCNHCGATYEQDEMGTLHNINGETKFKCIQDWYKWEREEVTKEVRNGTYHFEEDVVVKRLFNPQKVGWIRLGQMRFVHDYEGMHLVGNCDDGSPFEFHRPVDQLPSVHIEFNECDKKDKKNAGAAIDFANKNETYFGWLVNQKDALVKIHFATEAMHDMYTESLNKNQ